MNNWRNIWANKTLPADKRTLLQRMLSANGYDTGFGDISESAWRDYVHSVAAALQLRDDASVYDVGCGSGAFLLPLHQRGCTVGGLDYSANLLQIAAQHLGAQDSGAQQLNNDASRFMHGEAAQLSPTPQYDLVLASGVFFYFPSLHYAAEVLALMIRKSRRAVAVLDVPDAATEAEAMQFRRGLLGDAAYREKYRGLEHLYYVQSWFATTFAAHGITDVTFHPQQIDGYENNRFRYNVFARKPD